MIKGGNATIFVSDMNRSVTFYTKTLGLTVRFQSDEWTEVDAGNGLVLGLHPTNDLSPQPGQRGSISVGLTVTEPLEGVVETLKKRGVVFDKPITDDSSVRLAFLSDPDGNDLYLCELKKH